MARMLLKVAWITIAATAVSGCATSESYLPAIAKFRTATEQTAEAMKPYFLEMNRAQRREALARARRDDQPLALRDLQPLIDPAGIQVRVEATALLNAYARGLADAAGAKSVDDATKSLRQLGTRLQGLAKTLSTIDQRQAPPPPELSPARYLPPVTALVSLVFEALEKRQQERDLRDAILAGAERVRAILTLLAEDVEIVYVWRRDKLRVVLDARIKEYEKRLPTLTVQERWSMLQEIEAVASELEALESSRPVDLVRAQREAFEALVAFAQSPKTPQTLADLAEKVETYAAKAGDALDALRALQQPGVTK